MKAKYLFYSFALASAFTACSQDEMFDAPALESNEVAGRSVAGVVTFVNDEIESRYNVQDAKFENGDQMGLYLMDEFKAEPGNANRTYWNYQSAWWNMYSMVNYISTNYGYVYNAETEEWINRASQLVEGNYIALFPQNKMATNRRDLWHPIKANLDLQAHTTLDRYYVNRDNQFFVGYEQIKRDQKTGEATGELRANITMKPILTYLRMVVDNDASDKMRVRKVVFTKADKGYLPNVAYVKPAGIEMTDAAAQEKLGKTFNPIIPSIEGLKAPYWAWTNREEMAKKVEETEYCTKYTAAQGIYDRGTFTHAAARDMVQYGIATSSNAPYGMTNTSASKEYTFNFPGNGVELAGNYESNSDLTKVTISIALPAFEGWNELKVVVYADKWDGKQWVAGYISEIKGATGELNAAWNLSNMTLWDSDLMSNFPTATLAIDNGYFTKMDVIEVGSDKDFYNLVKGRLADADTNEGVELTVKPYAGTTLNVNQDVVDLVDAYAAENGAHKINITFTNGYVKLNAKNSVHKFNYSDVYLTLDADQTIVEPISEEEIIRITNNGQSTLTVLNSVNTWVNNYGTMVVKKDVVNDKTIFGYVKELNNTAFLTLGNGAAVKDLNNKLDAKTDVEAGSGVATVTTLFNEGYYDADCKTCGQAILNVNSGVLRVDLFNNQAEVNNASTIEVRKMNNTNVHVHAGVKEGIINNNGTIKAIKDVTDPALTNKATVNNFGTIDLKLSNYADVNGNGGNIEKLQNVTVKDKNGVEVSSGIFYVKSSDIHVKTLGDSNGKIVFDGVINQFVGTEGSDTKIYQTVEDVKDSNIEEVMTKTGITVLWLSHNVTIEQGTDGKAKTWSGTNRSKLTGIVVKAGKTVTLTSDKTGTALNIPNAVLTVESTAKLKINNAMNVTVKSYNGNIDLGSNSKLNEKVVHSGN